MSVVTAAAMSDIADAASDGCAGGTSEELRALDDTDRALFDVSVDHCGSSTGPDLADAVRDALALFELDELLAAG